jgi:hypothetical protein
MMQRTQISLDPELHRRARERASDLGLSLAAYIRALLARDLDSPHRPVDPTAVFDLGDSGGSDVARSRDRLVAEAVGAARARGRVRR